MPSLLYYVKKARGTVTSVLHRYILDTTPSQKPGCPSMVGKGLQSDCKSWRDDKVSVDVITLNATSDAIKKAKRQPTRWGELSANVD